MSNEPRPRPSDQAPPVAAAGAGAPLALPVNPTPPTDRNSNLGRSELRLPGSSMPADVAVPVARIYQPAPSPMRSAPFGERNWILEFAPGSPRDIEPLMGWTSGQDPFASINRLHFPNLESAIAFAERQGWRYILREPAVRPFRPRSYADKFRYDLTSALTRAQQPWDGGMSIAGGWPANQVSADVRTPVNPLGT